MTRVASFQDFCEAWHQLMRKWSRLERLLSRGEFAEWFDSLWENNANQYKFYELANALHEEVFGELLEFSRWEHAWQYCAVWHEDEKEAKQELIRALLGLY